MIYGIVSDAGTSSASVKPVRSGRAWWGASVFDEPGRPRVAIYRRRGLERIAMEGHLVICHWSARGLPLLREVRGGFPAARRPVVIVDERPGAVDLPDEPGFDDIYVLKGDPVNEVILRRAGVGRAFSVVVLAGDAPGPHADGKSVVTCLAVRDVCRGGERPSLVVECRDPRFRDHLVQAGADEVIDSDELGLRMMARTATSPGLTKVYHELLAVGRDANEVRLVPVPEAMVGRSFVEVNNLFARDRDGPRACLLIGVRRGDDTRLNPTGREAGPLEAGDTLILIGPALPDPS